MIKKLLVYTFLFFLQLLSAQQKYNLSITGRASNYNEACANQNFVRIWVVYEDGDRYLPIDHQIYDGYYENYNVLVEYDSNNPIVSIYTENRRQTSNAFGCNNDHRTYSHSYSITSEACWSDRIDNPFERLGNDYLEFEVSPIVNVSHTDGSPPARPKIVCETDLVSLTASPGFTPANYTYRWEFRDKINIEQDPDKLAEKQRLYQVMQQALSNMLACYSSGGNDQTCSEWVNDYERAKYNYDNYVVPGPGPIWRPITAGSANINVTLSDLYPNSSDYNEALGLDIEFRVNSACGEPSPDEISAIFLPEPPRISTPPTITQPTCSYSEDGGFSVVFDRRIFSYETLDINLLELNYGENPMSITDLETVYGGNFENFLNAINAAYTSEGVDVGIQTGHPNYNNSSRRYTWPHNLPAGEYVMQITGYRVADNIGGEIQPFCKLYTFFFNISAPTQVQFSAKVEQDETCFNANDGKIELTNVTGGSGSYYYSLNDGASWNNTPFTGPNYSIPVDLAPNTYNILVRDSNGCYEKESGSDPVTLTIKEVENDIVAVLGNIVRPGAPGLDDGVINITGISGGTPFVSGGVNYYEFILKDASNATVQSGNIDTTGDSLTGLTSGNYTITFKDQNGCETDPISIPISDPAPIEFSIEKSEAICFDKTATLEVKSITGGLGDDSENAVQSDYTVVWEKDGVFYANGTIASGENGIYKAVVTDKRSGRAERSIEITDDDIPQPIVVSIDNFEPVKCYGGNAVVTLGAVGGKTGITYQYSSDSGITWQDESTFNLPYKATPYRFMARDQKNISCRSEIVDHIINTQPTEILISGEATQHNNIFGGSIGALTISVSGGSLQYKSIVWRNSEDPGFTASGTSLSNLKAGFYQVVITDAQDCTMSLEDPIEITEPELLEITSAVPTHVNCFGESTGSINLTVTGGIGEYSYAWTKEDDNSFSAPNTNEITGLSQGTYAVTVADESQVATTSTTVVINQQPQVQITHTQEDNICYNDNEGSIDLTVIGGVAPYTFQWSNGETTEDISGLESGPYTVEVTDALGCTSNHDVTIGQPDDAVGLIFDVTQITAYQYNNGAIDITVAGGEPPYVYEWFADNGFTSANEDISGLAPGDYTLIVYDANYETSGSTACTIMEEFEIREPDELLGNISEEYSLFCYGDQNGELLANVTGGVIPYSYQWYRVENGSASDQNIQTPFITDIGQGHYRVTITDANGIEVTSEDYDLFHPEELVLQTISTTNVLCYGEATGAIDMQVSGGVLPYTITWNDGATTLDRENLTANNYSIRVEDANGCSKQTTVEIIHPYQEFRIEQIDVVDVTRFDGSDGSLSVAFSGGGSPHSITWTRESTQTIQGNTATITNLMAGDYTVVIADANGCSVSQTYSVTEPDIVEATLINPTCADLCDASLSISILERPGNYTYTWNTGSTSSTLTGLCAGTYTVSIGGFGDRILERTYEIIDPAPLVVDLGQDRVLCEGQTHSINAAIADMGAHYEWTSDTGFSSASPQVELTQSGTYSLTVTNSLGCVATDAITITRTTAVIGAEFAVSSQVFTGESVVLVDLSNPSPDVLEWVLPEEAEVVTSEKGYAEVVFKQAGEYIFGMYTELGECQAYQEKRVVVIEREKFTEGEGDDVSENDRNSFIESYVVYPNPSDGAFTLEIGLKEEKPVSVRIFGLVNNAMVNYRTLQNRKDYLVEYDLRHVSAGVYFVVLETPVSTQVKKLIIE